MEAAAEERQRLSQLVADLQELPDRQRGALVMRELNGLSHEELAQALGISVGAAKQTVFEARRALAEFQEGRAMACDQVQRVISDGDRRALRGRRIRAHLRECSSCSAFATAIPERRTALLALSPALPAAAAAGLFTRVTGASSAQHGSGGLLAGVAAKGGGGVGAAISSKALVTGVAIVATAAAGTAGIVKVVSSSGHASPAPSHRVLGTGQAGSSASLHSGSSSSGASLGLAAASHGKSSGRGATGGTHGGSSARAHGLGATPLTRHTGTRAAASSAIVSTGQGKGTGHSSSATNPNAHGGNPNAGATNPGSGSSNPNAHGSNPNAHGGNPNAAGGSSNAHGSNPNAHGGNPNAHGGNSNAHGSNPNAHGGNPNAGGANSHGHGHV